MPLGFTTSGVGGIVNILGDAWPGESGPSLDAVRSLIAANFPDYGSMPITRVAAQGAQNYMYRLGRELCIRLPRNQHIAIRLESETRWLPWISQHLPLLTPTPVAIAGPSPAFPLAWAIYRWIEGEPLSIAGHGDEVESALLLASFVKALRKLDPSGGPESFQDRRIADRDRALRAALPSVSHILNPRKVITTWERIRYSEQSEAKTAWTHGDLLPPNLLMQNGRLAAVIDFGCVGIGDPALDLLPAWSAFGEPGRAAFRNALEVDDSSWLRGQAIALHQAVVIAANQLAWNGPMLSVAVRMGRSALSVE